MVGALYTPTDGIVNPADACQMLAREAREGGVQFSERTRVVELLHETLDDGCVRVTGVEVEREGARHVIHCTESVLITGGQWTTPLAATLPPGPLSFFPTKLASPLPPPSAASSDDAGSNSVDMPTGVCVPTAIAPHQYAIFEHLGKVEDGTADKVTNALPVVRDYDCRYYLKPEVGGFMVGEFESPHKDMPSHVAARNASPSTIPHTAENELYEESMMKGEDGFEAALALCPELNT